MHHTTATEVPLSDEPDDVVPQRTGILVRRCALGAATAYALFSVAILIVEPGIVLSPVVWVLWAVVTAMAALTYEVGRHLSRKPLKVLQPISRDPSLQTHRWTVG